VLGHSIDFQFAVFPVLIDSALLVLVAVLYHRLTRRPYPSPQTSKQLVDDQPRRFTGADIDAALREFNQVIDVSRSDLETLLSQAEAVAYRRRLGALLCAQVMSRDVVSIQFGSSLTEAWALMRQHRVKALPVVDKARRIVGIVTQSDFLRHANLDSTIGLGERLRDFVRPSGRSSSDRPEVVGQIMTRSVRVASADRFVVDLVPLFSQHGHHHIPIVDADKRLVGIITQSDLVRALFNAATPGG
jgi:CBS domain-containing membrane protein